MQVRALALPFWLTSCIDNEYYASALADAQICKT